MMAYFKCNGCGKEYSMDTRRFSCGCGGLFSLVDEAMMPFDLSGIDQSEQGFFRYRRFFPLQNELWRDVTMGEVVTPMVRMNKDSSPVQCGMKPFSSNNGSDVKDNLWLKLDYMFPTGSFKDRGAALLVWLCKTIGVKKVIQDSSGNAGKAVAAYCHRAGIECEIYVPKGTSQYKMDAIRQYGAELTVFDGSRDETADACRLKAREGGIYYANHVYNPMFYQGTKTYIYEVYGQIRRIPGNLFFPVGNGSMLLGAEIALKELHDAGLISQWPKLFIVQSEKCAPLYGCNDGVPHDIVPEPTLAEGIAIGKPMRGKQILNSDYPGEREIITVPEESILPARELLIKQGYTVEPTTAATYAAYLDYISRHHLSGDSLIPLCGAYYRMSVPTG